MFIIFYEIDLLGQVLTFNSSCPWTWSIFRLATKWWSFKSMSHPDKVAIEFFNSTFPVYTIVRIFLELFWEL